MTKIALFLGVVWVAGFVMLTFMSFSRFLFDPPPPDGTRGGLFFARLFIAMFWWLMLPSEGGRRAMVEIMKGYEE